MDLSVRCFLSFTVLLYFVLDIAIKYIKIYYIYYVSIYSNMKERKVHIVICKDLGITG